MAQKKRISESLCIDCGAPIFGKILFCSKCAGKRKQKSKAIRLNRQASNLCVHCGKPLKTDEKKNCNKCKKRRCESTRKTQITRRKRGLCPSCGEIATIGADCEKCWFKRISRYNTGAVKNWLSIKKLLEKQEYKCVYTGKKLIPGKNASIDHIVPKSKGGNNSIKNLQWVDEQVNRIKNDMTHYEFITFCKLISNSF